MKINCIVFFLLIGISQLIYANDSQRISIENIDFYTNRNIEFNVNDSIKKNRQVVLDYKLAGRFCVNYKVDSLSESEYTKYMIEGFDYNWISDKNCQNIMLTNLIAGSYNIKIGIFENEELIEERQIPLVITPPFWKTWWFRAITTLGFLGVFIIGLIILAINNSRLRSKLKELNR